MSLLSVDQARERILSHFEPVSTETLPLTESADRVLAQEIAAAHDLPPFDNSSMDGFAVRAVDVTEAAAASPRSLPRGRRYPRGDTPDSHPRRRRSRAHYDRCADARRRGCRGSGGRYKH